MRFTARRSALALAGQKAYEAGQERCSAQGLGVVPAPELALAPISREPQNARAGVTNSPVDLAAAAIALAPARSTLIAGNGVRL